MALSRQENSDWRALYPFVSRWANVPGGGMHYIDERPDSRLPLDTRPTLLFVHGNPTWSFHWRRLVEALRGAYHCVAVDHIGCGLSEKPHRFLSLDDHIKNLMSLIDSLNLGRVTLVAQDWGGAIGLGAMLRMPNRLERIILFNTGAFPPRYIPWRIRACRAPVFGRLAVQGANAFSLAALRMTLARRSKLDSAVAAGYLAPYDSWKHRRAVFGFVKDIPSPRHDFLISESDLPRVLENSTWGTLFRIEDSLPTVADRPACLIWGMRDWCFRPDCLDRFVNVWPRAEVHRLGDVGHWVVEDAPEQSLAIVEKFLASQPATVCS